MMVFLGVIFFCSEVIAENSQTPQAFIAKLGTIQFSAGSAGTVPIPVLEALRAGKLSPVMQFLFLNHFLSACIRDIRSDRPNQRDSFVKAKHLYDDAFCRLNKCFMQGLVLSHFPELSGEDRDQAREQVLLLLSAISQSGKCEADKKNPQNTVDPNLLRVASQH